MDYFYDSLNFISLQIVSRDLTLPKANLNSRNVKSDTEDTTPREIKFSRQGIDLESKVSRGK